MDIIKLIKKALSLIFVYFISIAILITSHWFKRIGWKLVPEEIADLFIIYSIDEIIPILGIMLGVAGLIYALVNTIRLVKALVLWLVAMNTLQDQQTQIENTINESVDAMSYEINQQNLNVQHRLGIHQQTGKKGLDGLGNIR